MTIAAIGATFSTILATSTCPLAPVVAAAATPLISRMAELVVAEWNRKSRAIAEMVVQASQFGTGWNLAELSGKLILYPGYRIYRGAVHVV
jgi:hypothetical protein